MVRAPLDAAQEATLTPRVDHALRRPFPRVHTGSKQPNCVSPHEWSKKQV